jgi:hypothetical protein
MKPGRDLDAQIARDVMGWWRVKHNLGFEDAKGPVWQGNNPATPNILDSPIPKFSRDISAAWSIVEHFRGNGTGFEINDQNGLPEKGMPFWAVFKGHNPAIGSSVPHAICLAALMAKGIDVPG